MHDVITLIYDKALFKLNLTEHNIYHAHKCVKMPILVGILKYISFKDALSVATFKSSNMFVFQYFSCYV